MARVVLDFTAYNGVLCAEILVCEWMHGGVGVCWRDVLVSDPHTPLSVRQMERLSRRRLGCPRRYPLALVRRGTRSAESV